MDWDIFRDLFRKDLGVRDTKIWRLSLFQHCHPSRRFMPSHLVSAQNSNKGLFNCYFVFLFWLSISVTLLLLAFEEWEAIS